LLADYERSINDPEQLSLTNEIAIVDARIETILASLDDDTVESWSSAGVALDKFLATVAGGGSQQDQTAALDVLRDVIERGRQESAAWHELGDAFEQRRKLVDTEGKRRKAAQDSMDAQTAMLLLGAVVSIIKEHVKDRQTQNAIAENISRLVSQRSGSPAIVDG